MHALIIDNKPEEVITLQKFLSNKGIRFSYHYDDFPDDDFPDDNNILYSNLDFVFLDYELSELDVIGDSHTKDNAIVSLGVLKNYLDFSQNMHKFVLVMWTKYEIDLKYIEEVANGYNIPYSEIIMLENKGKIIQTENLNKYLDLECQEDTLLTSKIKYLNYWRSGLETKMYAFNHLFGVDNDTSEIVNTLLKYRVGESFTLMSSKDRILDSFDLLTDFHDKMVDSINFYDCLVNENLNLKGDDILSNQWVSMLNFHKNISLISSFDNCKYPTSPGLCFKSKDMYTLFKKIYLEKEIDMSKIKLFGLKIEISRECDIANKKLKEFTYAHAVLVNFDGIDKCMIKYDRLFRDGTSLFSSKELYFEADTIRGIDEGFYQIILFPNKVKSQKLRKDNGDFNYTSEPLFVLRKNEVQIVKAIIASKNSKPASDVI